MKKLFLAVMLTIMSSLAFTAEPIVCDGLKVATGPRDKGFSKLFADISNVTGAKLCEINTAGALDNLNVLSGNGADIGITDIGTLKDMAGGDENVAGLLALMPLNSNILHTATNASGFKVVGEKKYGILSGEEKIVYITKLSDLKGKRVALVGTAQLWTRKLDKQLGYGMSFVDVDGETADAVALDMVRKGQVYAVFTTAGWPHGALKKLKSSSGISLVAYDAPYSSPYTVKSVNYANIGVYNLPALAIQNVLVTRPFTGSKASAVAALRNSIAKNLVNLKDGEYEPGWKEIKNIDAAIDWNKFNSNKK